MNKIPVKYKILNEHNFISLLKHLVFRFWFMEMFCKHKFSQQFIVHNFNNYKKKKEKTLWMNTKIYKMEIPLETWLNSTWSSNPTDMNLMIMMKTTKAFYKFNEPRIIQKPLQIIFMKSILIYTQSKHYVDVIMLLSLLSQITQILH